MIEHFSNENKAYDRDNVFSTPPAAQLCCCFELVRRIVEEAEEYLA